MYCTWKLSEQKRETLRSLEDLVKSSVIREWKVVKVLHVHVWKNHSEIPHFVQLIETNVPTVKEIKLCKVRHFKRSQNLINKENNVYNHTLN